MPKASAPVVLPGGFQIKETVAAGAFAVVYEGIGPSGEAVAIKVLRDEGPIQRAFFEREIKVLATLGKNPQLASYRAHGRDKDGRPFLVTELVLGWTLHWAMETRGAASEPQTCKVIRQLCRALEGAHRLGIAHCDIKPKNVMIDFDRQRIVLVDFGLARDALGVIATFEREALVPGAEFSALRVPDKGMVLGTPQYMAPEQIEDAYGLGLPLSQTQTATDIFALGCLAYLMLTGKPPWPLVAQPNVSTQRELLDRYLQARLASKDMPLPQPKRCSAALWTILSKALRADPRRRQPDAAALRLDLERYMSAGLGLTTQRELLTITGDIPDVEAAIRAIPSLLESGGPQSFAELARRPHTTPAAPRARRRQAAQRERTRRPRAPDIGGLRVSLVLVALLILLGWVAWYGT